MQSVSERSLTGRSRRRHGCRNSVAEPRNNVSFPGCLSLDEPLTTTHGYQPLQRHSFACRSRCYHHNISLTVATSAIKRTHSGRCLVAVSAVPFRGRSRQGRVGAAPTHAAWKAAGEELWRRRGRARRRSPRQGARCTPKYYQCASFFFFYVSELLG